MTLGITKNIISKTKTFFVDTLGRQGEWKSSLNQHRIEKEQEIDMKYAKLVIPCNIVKRGRYCILLSKI
ncbi:hypothetical protein Avbf_13444 [Armadillidium vulgare]|nr:hypothetical protein Avbf_13444 [Armadillidium vulgare]